MKNVSLSSVPELSSLQAAERSGIVRQWQRAAVASWFGYLSYIAFSLFVTLSITFLPQLIFPVLGFPDFRNGVTPALLAVGIVLSNVLWTFVVVRRRRDLLYRILEERRRAP